LPKTNLTTVRKAKYSVKFRSSRLFFRAGMNSCEITACAAQQHRRRSGRRRAIGGRALTFKSGVDSQRPRKNNSSARNSYELMGRYSSLPRLLRRNGYGHAIHANQRNNIMCARTTLLALFLLYGCHRESKIPPRAPIAVQLTTVGTAETSGEALRYSASIVPYAQVDLTFRSSGYVTNVAQVRGADGRLRDIGTGDYAEQGLVLAHIRREDVENEVAQARAQLDHAVAQHTRADQDFQRAQALYTTKSLTRPDYDQSAEAFRSSQAAIDNATAALRQANLTLLDSDLKSPFAGYILSRKIDLGSLVSPSTAAFTFADISRVKVTFGVPDYVLPRVRLGQEIKIEAESGAAVSGLVTSISTAADAHDRTFAVEVSVNNPDRHLKPGMIATINLVEAPRSFISIPLSAIVPFASEPDAFAVVIVEDRGGALIAKSRKIQVQTIYDNSVAVEGVQPGERVVSAGAQLLKDGDSVQLIP
jgi:multidrug efflux system membrane fusion protein